MANFMDAIERAKQVAARLAAQSQPPRKQTPQQFQQGPPQGRNPYDPGMRPGSGGFRDAPPLDDRFQQNRPRYGLGHEQQQGDRFFGGPQGGRDFGRPPRNTMEMRIPAQYAGLVIGRGGESLKNIERTCGVRVNVSTLDNSPDEKMVTIQGDDSSIEQAKAMVDDILKEVEQRDRDRGHNPYGPQQGGHYGPGQFGGPPGGGMGPNMPMGPSTTVQIEVPANRIGLVIGRGGETIKSLQARSGCKIWTLKEQDTPMGSPVRVVFIQGSDSAIPLAKELIDEIVNSQPNQGHGTFSTGPPPAMMGFGNGPPPLGYANETFRIPRDKVGLIIGKGGESLKALKNQYQVQIDLEHDRHSQDESIVTIIGALANVQGAKSSIWEKAFSEPIKGAKPDNLSNQHMYSYGYSATYNPAPFVFVNVRNESVPPKPIVPPTGAYAAYYTQQLQSQQDPGQPGPPPQGGFDPAAYQPQTQYGQVPNAYYPPGQNMHQALHS